MAKLRTLMPVEPDLRPRASPGVRRSACRGDRPRPYQAECRRRGDGRRAARRVRALVGFRHFADLACGQMSAYRRPRVFPQRPRRISGLATDAPSGCRATNNMGHGANRIVQTAVSPQWSARSWTESLPMTIMLDAVWLAKRTISTPGRPLSTIVRARSAGLDPSRTVTWRSSMKRARAS
jgi:hypothetical protein